ncbi:MAG: ASKHA domain-containing protein [Desulfobacteraceae bacterium]
MPRLHVTMEDGEDRLIPFESGRCVREILDTGDIGVRSDCGGNGICGQCLVCIERGAVNDPTVNEQRNLPAGRFHRGIRLACQVRPLQDVRITIENPAPPLNWRPLCGDEYTPLVCTRTIGPATLPEGAAYGAAVDLGTTQIRLTLWDMEKGRRLSGRSGLNPQARYGADILTRLTAASESGKRADDISRLAKDAIGKALGDICSRESLVTSKIGNLVIVGNTAMIALLTGKNHDALLQPDYWTRQIDCRPEDTKPWRIDWGIAPGACVDFVQPLAGFVGSDLLAGVLAVQLIEGPSAALLIDFGTNSEIALWDGQVLWITSTAAGPAFEGWGIGCGMPAQPGAIHRVEPEGAGPGFNFDVIGQGQAKGLCGSGLVDIVACLLKGGILKKNGMFANHIRNRGLIHIDEGHRIVLKKRDVDIIQRAKAAIGAGTKCLMDKAGMGLDDLKRVCICGAFGRFLNIANAQDIGLVPGVSIRKVERFGNAALAGCEFLLFSRDREKALLALKKRSKLLNLSKISEFEKLFIENLFLQPMEI